MRVVVKIGTSSLTTGHGSLSDTAVDKLASEVATVVAGDHQVLIVTSAAIAAGLPPLGFEGESRPRDPDLLRAASAIGQISLIANYQRALADNGLVAGQVLLAPTDFWFRKRYLKSRGTIGALLARGVIPVINENDAVADDEIRFGDNDRLAALVAHLIDAHRLVLLTDTPGLFTADPRIDDSASLIEEIVEFDQRLDEMAGGPGSGASRGGMASKLAAAKIATWSGVETVIAHSERPDVLVDAVAGVEGVGTLFRPRAGRLGARKLWIAFALPASGRVVVDGGARQALEHRQKSLLAAGVKGIEGSFSPDDAVEVVDESGEVFAKGLVQWDSGAITRYAGQRTADLPTEIVDDGSGPRTVPIIHRDDLVILPL
ncbi:MAG: glutamate 5-kinase [Actinomycetia bacterium]|nr:glutamate 5-kinase [Actinomycetes bacterium]MCP5032551.1 glutamate 5-kinase [Actinomycetes bacterium]